MAKKEITVQFKLQAPGGTATPAPPIGPALGQHGVNPGQFIQQFNAKHRMDLSMTFRQGSMTGEGRDWVGKFVIRGRYSVEDGKCYWTKRYVGRHDVFYQGFNEGKGIWGKWEIPATASDPTHWHGGFHIWPEGMGDPTNEYLTEQADLPIAKEFAAWRGIDGSMIDPDSIHLAQLIYVECDVEKKK